MTLSDKVCDTMTGYMIYSKDVKQFIKDLKDICDKNDGYCSIDDINREAGDKLL